MTSAITRRRSVVLGCALCLTWALGRSVSGNLLSRALAAPSGDTDAGAWPVPGRRFSYRTVAEPPQTADEVDLTPNAHPAVAGSDEGKVVFNGVEFAYDTVSGATVLPSRTPDGSIEPMDADEKASLMFWSVQAPVGIVTGEYYRLDKRFNEGEHQDKEDPDDYFLGTADLVVSDGTIRHIEFDEIPAASYYNERWASQTKRRSGYAFFQAGVPRTDVTLVTWVNGQTFLEWQILFHNSLDPIFDTVYGSSNSGRDVFVPAARELAQMVQEPSGRYYIGISLPDGEGVSPRLQLVFEGERLVEARYDEIFADRSEDIADPEMRRFFRQSKYDSVDWREHDGGTFRSWADDLAAALVAQGTLDLGGEAFEGLSSQPEFANVQKLADAVAPAVDDYLANGYEHNVGSIAERPEGMVERPDQINRQDDILMELLGTEFSDDGSRCTFEVRVENVSDEPYELDTASFYLYVKNELNLFDTLADIDPETVEVPAHESRTVLLDIAPIRESDSDFALRYDGRNKVFYSMVLPD